MVTTAHIGAERPSRTIRAFVMRAFHVPTITASLLMALFSVMCLRIYAQPMFRRIPHRGIRWCVLLALGSVIGLCGATAYEFIDQAWANWYFIAGSFLHPFSEMHFFAVLAGVFLAAICLLAIWLGLEDRWPFIWRFTFLNAILLPLWIIPAYDLLLFALTVLLTVGLWIHIWGWNRARTVADGESRQSGRSVRISLGQSLVAVAFAAIFMSLLIQYPPVLMNKRWSFGTTMLGTSIMAISAAWTVYGRLAIWKRLLGTLVLLFLVCTARISSLGDNGLGWPSEFVPTWPVAFVIMVFCVVAWLISARAARIRPFANRLCGAGPFHQRSRVAACTLFVMSAILGIPTATAYWTILRPQPAPTLRLPEPNAYELVMNRIAEFEPFDFSRLPSLDVRRQRAVEHVALLEDVRKMLNLPSRAVVDYTALYDWQTENLLHRKITSLIELFPDATIIALDRGDFDDAFAISCDLARLRRVLTYGNLSHHILIALECEETAYAGMAHVRRTISPRIRQQAIVDLRRLNADREAPEEIWHRTQVWREHHYGWEPRLAGLVGNWRNCFYRFAPDPYEYLLSEPDFRWHDVRLRLMMLNRLLQTDLALRHYADLYGEYPESLNDLVPSVLDELPLDPYTEEPFQYRRLPADIELYSVGPNGVDDGSNYTMHPNGYPLDVDLDRYLSSRNPVLAPISTSPTP